MRALEGIRVLDLGEFVSGAYCCKLLGAFGAEVIKVESPAGDRARHEGPFAHGIPHPENSALFSYLNTGKLGITLDFHSERSQQILRKLVEGADALVENHGPEFLPSIGLTLEKLREWSPRLITVSISYFGESGPYVRYRGSPLVAYAMGGYMYLTGEPDREPLQSAGPQPEYLAGVHGAIGALTALLAREESGMGQHVEVPIFEMMVTLHQFTFSRFNHAGVIQKRIGNRYSSGHPITIYPCRNGHIALSASTEEQGQRLLQMMDKSELLEDPRFATLLQRLANADAFDALVQPWIAERSKEELFHLCQEWRVPCAPVTTVEDLLQDPHFAARQFWQKVDHPVAGTAVFPGPPFRMSETSWTAGRAPLLGEHNQLVYGGRLGYGAEELASLKRDGVI